MLFNFYVLTTAIITSMATTVSTLCVFKLTSFSRLFTLRLFADNVILFSPPLLVELSTTEV